MNEHRETSHPDHKHRGAAFGEDDRDPEIHADFTRAVVVDTTRMDWQASPAAGVWRKRLELIGSENPRLTTIVRFEPGSRFDEHGHPGGEEFLVLSGAFSDASGDFPAGTYVRNPSGWVHAPWTDKGCELFVKLCQFQSDDKQRVVLDSQAPSGWKATGHPGLSRLTLHVHGDEVVALYRVAAGAEAVCLSCPQGAEILLLEGSLEGDAAQYRPGTWLRFPAGTRYVLRSELGCRFYCKTVSRGSI
jgi:anti-sigma factor ChrR (cupin superfamily)